MSVMTDHIVYMNGKFMKQTVTGVQRYARELSYRLEDLVVPVIPRTPVWRGLGQLWEQLIFPFTVPQDAVVWSPCGSGSLFLSQQVITVHDLSHIIHPEWYHPLFVAWYQWLLPRVMKKAKRIITVSEYSRQQLISYYRMDPERVRVTPLGVDESFYVQREEKCELLRAQYGIEGKYILAVSSNVPRKNFAGIVKAWSMINSELPEYSLVIVGKEQVGYSSKTHRFSSVPERTIFTGYVPDEDLPYLYAGAEIFVYPSFYEGFGLPILEAMAAGTPVLTSNLSSMPEVAGDAALLVDPYNILSIATGMISLASDEKLREDLARAGRSRARSFSWDRTAELTREILIEARGGMVYGAAKGFAGE